MRCPTCQHPRTRIIRTRPEPDAQASDLVRQCKAPGCLAVFTSRETVISVIENSADSHILLSLASKIEALPSASRTALLRLIQAR